MWVKDLLYHSYYHTTFRHPLTFAINVVLKDLFFVCHHAAFAVVSVHEVLIFSGWAHNQGPDEGELWTGSSGYLWLVLEPFVVD